MNILELAAELRHLYQEHGNMNVYLKTPVETAIKLEKVETASILIGDQYDQIPDVDVSAISLFFARKSAKGFGANEICEGGGRANFVILGTEK